MKRFRLAFKLSITMHFSVELLKEVSNASLVELETMKTINGRPAEVRVVKSCKAYT